MLNGLFLLLCFHAYEGDARGEGDNQRRNQVRGWDGGAVRRYYSGDGLQEQRGDGGLFTREGMAKDPFPGGWKGEKGLYCVGFTRRGLLGASHDALNIARDILLQWKKPSHHLVKQ
ncbi:hypothetical protein BHM03_00057850 [Ensete ventricosum]|nr:hypothetical protein BHM03_00057850 [Ensete ventricosum]